MILLKYDSRSVREPIIAKTAIETETLLNIIKASVGARQGEIIIEVEDAKADEVMEKLRAFGVEAVKIEGRIEKDDELCVHCGACISICPVEVFSVADDKKVVADSQKCIRCGVCVTVCPLSALSLPE